MDLLKQFLEHIQRSGWQLQQQRLLVAVSGGLDSVVLAHLCKAAGFSFAIAHCNFQLRGPESDEEEQFVRHLAQELDVVCFVRKFNTAAYAAEHKQSNQVAARELRYAWFDDVLHQEWLPGSSFTLRNSRLLTAHHRDDSIETLLLNFLKGTGVAGLQGIPAENGRVLRPLLFAGRAELRQWAEARGLAWRDDSSNNETKYTRNALRHEVLPVLERIFPQVRQNLASNLRRFAGLQELYRASVDLQVKKLLDQSSGEARVPVRKLLQATASETILFEMARLFGFTPAQTDGLLRLLQSPPGRYIDSATHRAIRYGHWLHFAPLQPSDKGLRVLDRNERQVLLGTTVLRWEEGTVPVQFPDNPSIACLDAAAVAFPLIVRRWKEGDYFYPLGMRKKKKLARFFIDSKVPRHQREQLWVVESHKRIVWVAGLRIDDRFKVTPATRRVLRLELSAASDNDSPAPAAESFPR